MANPCLPSMHAACSSRAHPSFVIVYILWVTLTALKQGASAPQNIVVNYVTAKRLNQEHRFRLRGGRDHIHHATIMTCLKTSQLIQTYTSHLRPREEEPKNLFTTNALLPRSSRSLVEFYCLNRAAVNQPIFQRPLIRVVPDSARF